MTGFFFSRCSGAEADVGVGVRTGIVAVLVEDASFGTVVVVAAAVEGTRIAVFDLFPMSSDCC